MQSPSDMCLRKKLDEIFPTPSFSFCVPPLCVSCSFGETPVGNSSQEMCYLKCDIVCRPRASLGLHFNNEALV